MTQHSALNILNDESSRMIKMNYRKSDFLEYKDMLKTLTKLKSRIYIVFMSYPQLYHFIEGLYDAGLRRGDAILIGGNTKMTYPLIQETDENSKRKIIELLYNSITFDQAEWIGEYGQKIKEGFIKEYSEETDFRCISFDAAMLILNGIKYTLNKGEDIWDSNVLNQGIRYQKFMGCSGFVSINPDGNDRSTSIVAIYNIR